MTGRIRSHCLWVALLVTLTAAANAQQPDIVGSWRGTSICVDPEHFPSCHNEQVIYDVRPKASRDTVTIRADKVVNGVRELMAEFDLALTTDTTWVADYQNPNTHVRITLRVRGTSLTGSLVNLPSGLRVRQLTLERAH